MCRLTRPLALQVACTCLSTNSAMLARRVFDVCIVDEASQITLPATVGALLKVRPNPNPKTDPDRNLYLKTDPDRNLYL